MGSADLPWPGGKERQKGRQTIAELEILGVKASTLAAVKQLESGKCRDWPSISAHNKQTVHLLAKR